MGIDQSRPVPILDLSAQYSNLKDEFLSAVTRILESGQFILGPEVARFEEEIAAFLGVKHFIGLNSGTDALVIALRALGIGPGDEVITSPFSFFATAESISLVGATPVFCDVDEESFNLDPALIEEKITPRTKAIMPVHLFGRPAAMGKIVEIAEKHGLKIVEDAAQAIGAAYQPVCAGCACAEATRDLLAGKYCGSMGAFGAFSFYPTKNLGAYGDAGGLSTNDDALAELARKLRTHGSLKAYHNEILGYNSRMDALQASILRVKLPHIADWNAARRRVAARYNELLAGVDGVTTPNVPPGHVFHQYTVRISGGRRDRLKEALAAKGVGTMVYYPIPQDELPVYAGKFPPNPMSRKLAGEVLSLPIWPEISDEVQVHIAETLSRTLAEIPAEGI